MKRDTAYLRIALFTLGFVAGCIVWRFASSSIEALRILVTIFSILVGMLIAILTISGDPKSIFPGSWRIASAHRREIRRALGRYTLLIYIYLIVIGLAFVGSLGIEFFYNKIMERLALSIGAAALVWSFGLPIAIYQFQITQLDKEVANRRESKSNQDL